MYQIIPFTISQSRLLCEPALLPVQEQSVGFRRRAVSATARVHRAAHPLDGINQSRRPEQPHIQRLLPPSCSIYSAVSPSSLALRAAPAKPPPPTSRIGAHVIVSSLQRVPGQGRHGSTYGGRSNAGPCEGIPHALRAARYSRLLSNHRPGGPPGRWPPRMGPRKLWLAGPHHRI